MTSSTALGLEVFPKLVASKASGVVALAGAAAGLAQSVSFAMLRDPLLAGLFLMLGSLMAVPALVALTARLAQPMPVSALPAIVLAVAAALARPSTRLRPRQPAAPTCDASFRSAESSWSQRY